MIRLFALLALLLAVPAAAQLEAPSDPVATPTPEQTIAATRDAGDDERIAERISGIFSELPAFRGVDIMVREGVVSLSGTVPKPEDVSRAEAIVSRVSGVVTVENGLERDLSLSAGSAGISNLADRWNGFLRMLPLIAAALAVWAIIARTASRLATSTWAEVTLPACPFRRLRFCSATPAAPSARPSKK